MAKKMTDKITDFGEKIGGARKDLWKSRGLCEDDLEEMNEKIIFGLVRTQRNRLKKVWIYSLLFGSGKPGKKYIRNQ